MSAIEIVAVAVALAMDAFAVSVAAGVTMRRVSGRQTFRMAWHFGLFQAVMPIIGWAAGLTVADLISAFDHWVAFGLLVFISGQMIVGAIRDGDADECKSIEGWSLVVMAIATSIDALAVGLSLAMLSVSIWVPAVVIGLVAAALTAFGLHLGGYVGRRLSVARYAGVMGGLVLLVIAGKILHEHGVF